MAEQDFDRSEQATPYRLEKARQEGSVAKSVDLNALAMLATGVTMLYATGWDRVVQSVYLQKSVFAHMTRSQWTVDGVAAWMGELAIGMLHILAPLFLALAVVAILINLVQTGPIFSIKPLSPDLSRINPVTGLKRLFSIRIVYEVIKSLIKFALLGSVAYYVIWNALPDLAALIEHEPRGYAQRLLELTGSVLIKMVCALLLVAVIDTVFTRWEYAKRMRMSTRDIKDEVKNREGDPRVRARIRELRNEMMKRSRAMSKLPTADVLITNPTRIAVAVSYKHGKSEAPQLIAKGAGELARKMRELASRHNIPIVQNRMLARALFREVDQDAFIPEKWYPHVAKIMVWVYVMREARQSARRLA